MVQFLYPSALQKCILAWIPKSVQRNRQLRDVEAKWWGTWCQAVLLPSEACPPSRQTDHLNQGHRESKWHEAESCRKMKYGDSFTDLDNQQQRTWSSRLCAVACILFYVHLLVYIRLYRKHFAIPTYCQCFTYVKLNLFASIRCSA